MTTRRGAFRLLAGAAGLSLGEAATAARNRQRHRGGASRKQGRVSAQSKPGNSDCARFCTAVFPPGPGRGRCVRDAAHGAGLCHECGADTAQVCELSDGSFRCCGATGGFCLDGACCTPKTCADACTCGVLDPGCGLPPIDCAQECGANQYCEISVDLGFTCCNCGDGIGCGFSGGECPNGDVLNPGSGGPNTCDGQGGPGGGPGGGGPGGGMPGGGGPGAGG